MVVALGTFDRQTEYSLSKCFGLIDQVFDPVLFIDHTAFFRVFMVAEKTGSEDLLLCRIGQHVTCYLPGEKLVVRNVCVEGMYYPIPPWPLCANIVILVAITIVIP